MVELLLRAGAAVDPVDLQRKGWLTPLHIAALAGNAEMVGILLRAGADPSSPGSGDPFSPLDAAFAGGSAAVFRLLVEAGADLGAKGLFGLWAPDFAEKAAFEDPGLGEIALLFRRAAGGGLL